MQIMLPENLSTRLRRLAARRQQPVETVLADRLFTALDEELDTLPTDEQVELRALHHLSNDALRAIAAEQMSPANQGLMAQLMERNSKGQLSREEQERRPLRILPDGWNQHRVGDARGAYPAGCR